MLNGLLKLLGKAGHDVGKNVTHDVQVAGNALHTLLGHPPQQPGRPVPPLPTGAANPASIGRVWGTLVAQNTADQQGFSPMFRNIVQGAHPFVGALSNPSAGGEYWPATNQIKLSSNDLDPYTVTHEGLHAAFQRKTPQAQGAFFRDVASTATPSQRKSIDNTLDLPMYAGSRARTDNGDTFGTDTEIHSYLPEYGAKTPAQAKYYGRYFSNPNFYQEGAARHKIQASINPRIPQFSDWFEN